MGSNCGNKFCAEKSRGEAVGFGRWVDPLNLGASQLSAAAQARENLTHCFWWEMRKPLYPSGDLRPAHRKSRIWLDNAGMRQLSELKCGLRRHNRTKCLCCDYHDNLLRRVFFSGFGISGVPQSCILHHSLQQTKCVELEFTTLIIFHFTFITLKMGEIYHPALLTLARFIRSELDVLYMLY